MCTIPCSYLEAEGMEKTYKFKQTEIADAVDLNTANKIFDLKMDGFGPYKVNYSRSGRCENVFEEWLCAASSTMPNSHVDV